MSANSPAPTSGLPLTHLCQRDVLDAAAARVLQLCDELALCTDQPGEITRTFCSAAMRKAHEQIAAWAVSGQLSCRMDAVGNLIIRRPSTGAQKTGAVLLIGSHLDTVVNGGRFDGILGVMLGLVMAELLQKNAAAIPFAIDVIGFCEEEGVRYQTPFIGSRALVGDLPDELLQRRDAMGISMRNALRTFGGNPEQRAEAIYNPRDVVAYIEPHIEQGPVLESANLPVGVVTGITGQTRASLVFTGEAGHAGTVPMTARRDALAAAAAVVSEVERIARARPGLVGTVGCLNVTPNVANVIPAMVEMRLDVRHLDGAVRGPAVAEIIKRAEAIARERGIGFEIVASQDYLETPCDAGLVDTLEAAVTSSGVKPMRLPSGAGHDAAVLATKFPMAMLFVRCKGGISHHPAESVTQADVAVALEVLLRAVFRLSETSLARA